MESTWLTKEIFKKALEERRVYLTTQIKTSKGITGYNVYILDNNDRDTGTTYRYPTQMLCVVGHSQYWSDSKECYHIVAWGTSRPLEIILSIGKSLGLPFGQIPQTHQMI